MALLRQKTKAKKAQLEASAAAAEARRAAQESAAAVRDLAQALVAQVRQMGLDEKTADALERVRSSETYGKAQTKAAELGKRVTDSDAYTSARQDTARRTSTALAGLGTWLATGGRGEKLGITTSKRRGGGWLFALLGVGLGYAIGILTAPKQGREIRDQIASRGGQRGDRASTRMGQDWDGLTPPSESLLADKVRTRLGEDPRTSDLSGLNVDVVEGVVVVRGAMPESGDEAALRDVVTSVEGVQDVDLRLGSTAG